MLIHVDASKTCGTIKQMNSVNNGPSAPNVRVNNNNFDKYMALEIPMARNHDASFYGGYGGEHTVDVHRIFKNFDADENDPKNYFFIATDGCVKNTLAAGTGIFYRLGASIEHGIKYGTRVPSDFGKWARICEHIIRHYNEGWADGFHYNITYWEIWNEPDCRNADGSNPCWQGTDEQFIELYCTAAKHLKSCFPNLKIGGPAFCTLWSGTSFVDDFLERVHSDNIPLDFFSYHWYGGYLENFAETIQTAQKLLEKHGLGGTETILNEWNYVHGWLGEDWIYTIKSEQGLKGASFITGAMCVGQAQPLDILMYYDAQPSAMNGMFENGGKCRKGYYPFVMFRDLKRLGNWIPTEAPADDIYSCAATDGSATAVMLTHYSEDDTKGKAFVSVAFDNVGENRKALIYRLDDEKDLELVSEEYFTSGKFTLYLSLPLFTSVMIKIVDMDYTDK